MSREALTLAQQRDYDQQRAAHPDKPLVVLVARFYEADDSISVVKSACCFKRDDYAGAQRWTDWWLSCRPEGSTGQSLTIVQEP